MPINSIEFALTPLMIAAAAAGSHRQIIGGPNIVV
jgi:hypothetical protein